MGASNMCVFAFTNGKHHFLSTLHTWLRVWALHMPTESCTEIGKNTMYMSCMWAWSIYDRPSQEILDACMSARAPCMPAGWTLYRDWWPPPVRTVTHCHTTIETWLDPSSLNGGNWCHICGHFWKLNQIPTTESVGKCDKELIPILCDTTRFWY